MSEETVHKTGAVTTVADPASDPLTAQAPASQIPALADLFGGDRRIDVTRFDAPAHQRIADIAARVPLLDGAAVNAFGVEPQMKANRFLDDLLEGVRTSDAGGSGALLAELATGVKAIDIAGMKREAEGRPTGLLRSALGLVPFVKDRISAFKRFRANYTHIVTHFAAIEDRGRLEMARLAAMDSKMDRLVAENLANLRDLELTVAAGQIVLDRERARFNTQRDDALASRDPIDLASVRDLGDQVNAFETRLLRLHMAMTDAMLSIPQTRLTQSAGRIEYRNIMDTLLFDLPRLKSAILRIAALKGIGDASKASEARRKLANQMGAAGVDALDQAYTRAKLSEGGAIAEITAMGAIADRILGIVDKGAAIDAKNRAERDQAHIKLAAIKTKFVDALQTSTANAVGGKR